MALEFFFGIYICNGCLVLDTGMSQLQFGALELSQSQDFESDFVPHEGDARHHQLHSGVAVLSSRLLKNESKYGKEMEVIIYVLLLMCGFCLVSLNYKC